MSWLYNIYLKKEPSEPVPTTEAEHSSIKQKEKKIVFQITYGIKLHLMSTFHKVEKASLTCTLLKYLFSL